MGGGLKNAFHIITLSGQCLNSGRVIFHLILFFVLKSPLIFGAKTFKDSLGQFFSLQKFARFSRIGEAVYYSKPNTPLHLFLILPKEKKDFFSSSSKYPFPLNLKGDCNAYFLWFFQFVFIFHFLENFYLYTWYFKYL